MHRPFYYGSHDCTPEQCGHDGETCPARKDRPIGRALADSVPLGDGEHHVVQVQLFDQGGAGCGLPQTERKGDWMHTFTGRQYWPLDPRPDEVCVEDIAHHLGMMCRYCGACRRFYSVAEHSVGVLHVVTQALWHGEHGRNLTTADVRRIRRHALMHDAPEAYCHDLIRPIKRCVSGYAEVEAANHDAVCLRYGLGLVGTIGSTVIKLADNAMLLAEQAALMAPAPAKWSPIDVPAEMLADAKMFLERNGTGWSPQEAKVEFLGEWEALLAA